MSGAHALDDTPQISVMWSRDLGDDAGRWLLRAAVARYRDIDPRVVRVARLCRGCGSSAHGRPVVLDAGDSAPPHVSLSRAARIVLVAVTDAGPVGVDVEEAGSADFEGFDTVTLHDAEGLGDPTTTWVRKESVLKATGHGLAVDPRLVRLGAGESPRVVAWPDGLPDPSGVQLIDLDLPTGFVGALAVMAGARPRLSVREEAPEP